MITKLQIDELKNTIKALNQLEYFPNNHSIENVEDIKYLIETLTAVKVNKLKSLIQVHQKHSKNLMQTEYTKDSVIELFTKNEVDNIIQSYTLAQLKDMFIAVYRKKPLSKSNKKDITYDIYKMIQQIKRAIGFKEINKELNEKNY